MSTPYEKLVNPPKVPAPSEQDAATVQARYDWLQSSETQRVVKKFVDDSNRLIADAIGLARVNHQSDNSKQIIHKLIEADTLRKVVDYATRN